MSGGAALEHLDPAAGRGKAPGNTKPDRAGTDDGDVRAGTGSGDRRIDAACSLAPGCETSGVRSKA
jgi:hypothetical protein